MQLVPTRIHGIIDYTLSALLLIGPWWLGGMDGASVWTLVSAAAIILVVNFFTNYELGILPRLETTTHLRLDMVLGALLALSPWLLGFHGDVWVPHVVVGASVILLALITRSHPQAHTPDPSGSVGTPKANDAIGTPGNDATDDDAPRTEGAGRAKERKR